MAELIDSEAFGISDAFSSAIRFQGRDEEAAMGHGLLRGAGTLEHRVMEQAQQLERLGRLKHFVSRPVAEAIMDGKPLESHRREITVVFLDLRGFTAFAERTAPEDVMAVLREYHAAMGELVHEHDGTLERFTGDGMMIFFNDPVPVPNPAERAVRMAIAMRDRAQGLEHGWLRLQCRLALGIGIAHGYATVGAIGFDGRWDYSAIGIVTNLASRLCSRAKGGQILICPRVAREVESVAEFDGTMLLRLRGFLKPVPAVAVRGLRSVGDRESVRPSGTPTAPLPPAIR